jgi:hypothetical protein
LKPRIQVTVLGTVWFLLAALSFLKWHAPIRGWIFATLGAGFIVSGLFIPSAAAAIHRFLGRFGAWILLLLSWILLAGVFFLLILPLGWILRATGSLRTRRPPAKPDSYWVDRPEEPPSVDRYLRPF